ncbi:MAG: O-antigen ligase family protein [Halieaceae bacterium]|nr:O-antigen ligase family protein [Halieaceae bacterium]
MPDADNTIDQPQLRPPQRLLAPLLGCSLALALVTPKGFGVVLALAVLVALWLLRPAELARLRLQDGVFLVLFNTYPVLVAFSMLLHGSQDFGLFDNASRFLLLSILYLGLRTRPYDLSPVVLGAMAGCALAFCAAAVHFAYVSPSSADTLGRFVAFENAVVFAHIAFFLLLIAITPTSLSGLAGSRVRLLLIAVVILASGSLVVSQSRGVLVALLVLYVYLLFFDRRLPGHRLTRYLLLLSGIGTGVFLVSTPYLYHLGGTAAELAANYREIDQLTSLGQRLAQWSVSWRLILEEPFLGYGVGRFNEALNSLPDAAALTATVRGYNHAHNEYLHLAVEQGLVGLVVFLCALAGILYLTFRERFAADARHLLVGAIGFWLYFGLTQTQFAHQKTTMMFALLLVLGFSRGMNLKYGPVTTTQS